MTRPSAETVAQRANTEAFIQADYTMVNLQYVDLVDTPAGGKRGGSPGNRGIQKFRLVPQGEPIEQELLDGQLVRVDYTLVGMPDVVVERGDWFFLQGDKYEVVSVKSVGDYEIKAEVTNRG